MKKWEYYYLSNTEWKERIAVKVDYTFKFILNRHQRNEHRQKCEQAVQEILNELGDDGWELVSTLPLLKVILGSGGSAGSEMIFRREKDN